MFHVIEVVLIDDTLSEGLLYILNWIYELLYVLSMFVDC